MTHIQMTNSQKKTIKEIIRQAITRKFYDLKYTGFYNMTSQDIKNSKYEIKNLTIEPLDAGSNTICLIIDIGGKNDEGTLASMYCRDRLQVFIGRKGGVTSYRDSKKSKHGMTRLNGFTNSIIHGWS